MTVVRIGGGKDKNEKELKQLCPIPMNVKNDSISFFSDSFNKQCVSFNARGSDYARTMQDMVQQYERPNDKNDTAPGDLMSTK